MDRQIFSDGIGQVTIIDGTVRLDFVAFSATEKDAKGQPAAIFCQRIILSADGFRRAAEKIQEAVQAVSKLTVMPREVRPEPAATPDATVATRPVPPPERPFP